MCIRDRVDDIPDTYSKTYNGVKLLTLGTVETGGGGCVCPEHVDVYKRQVLEGIAHAGKGDLVITFGFGKLSEESRMILSCAKTAGFRTMAFTSRLYAPAGQQADISLYVYRGGEEEYHSMTAAAAVADALVLAVSEQLKEASARSLVRVQKLKEAYRKKEI